MPCGRGVKDPASGEQLLEARGVVEWPDDGEVERDVLEQAMHRVADLVPREAARLDPLAARAHRGDGL